MQAGRQAGICVNMQVEGMASFYKVNKSIADIRLNFFFLFFLEGRIFITQVQRLTTSRVRGVHSKPEGKG